MDGRTEKPLFLATLLYWQKRRNQINVAVSETMSQVFTAEFSFAIESRDGIAKKKTVRLVVLLESLLYGPIDLVLMIKHCNNQIKHQTSIVPFPSLHLCSFLSSLFFLHFHPSPNPFFLFSIAAFNPLLSLFFYCRPNLICFC